MLLSRLYDLLQDLFWHCCGVKHGQHLTLTLFANLYAFIAMKRKKKKTFHSSVIKHLATYLEMNLVSGLWCTQNPGSFRGIILIY